jgi:hypothetical protein
MANKMFRYSHNMELRKNENWTRSFFFFFFLIIMSFSPWAKCNICLVEFGCVSLGESNKESQRSKQRCHLA